MAHFGSRLDIETSSNYPDLANAGMWLDGDVLIVSHDDGVSTYDVSDPSNLAFHDYQSLLSGAVGEGTFIDTVNKLFYVSMGFNQNFYVVDYTIPGTLVIRDSIHLTASAGPAPGLVVNGNYAYVAGITNTNAQRIKIVNISDPDNVVEEADFVDAVNLAGVPMSLLTDGTYLYVGTTSRFSVFTFSGASLVFSNGFALSHTASGGYSRMRFDKNEEYIYRADANNDLILIVDCTTPTAVSESSEFSDAFTDGVEDLQVVSDILYVMMRGSAPTYVTAYDISAPTTPVLLESLDISTDTFSPGGIAVESDFSALYVSKRTTAESKGLASFEIDFGYRSWPTNALTRVTNLVHRYDRASREYSLEIIQGDVTSDFGLPEWMSQPRAARLPDDGAAPTSDYLPDLDPKMTESQLPVPAEMQYVQPDTPWTSYPEIQGSPIYNLSIWQGIKDFFASLISPSP